MVTAAAWGAYVPCPAVTGRRGLAQSVYQGAAALLQGGGRFQARAVLRVSYGFFQRLRAFSVFQRGGWLLVPTGTE